LAGSFLAWYLLQAGQKVLIVDDSSLHSSSRVAAGLFNPVTGRRIVKSWMADDLFPFAKDIYQSLEKEFKGKFYFEIPLLKMFNSDEERELTIKKMKEDGSDIYISKIYDSINIPGIKKFEYGGVEFHHTGYVDTKILLNEFRNFFIKNKIFASERIDYSAIKVDEEGITWNGIVAKKIIFAEGIQLQPNPFFQLPFVPAKGELLLVKSKLRLKMIVNRNGYIVPLGDNLFKVGSTFNWDDLTPNPTAEGRKALENIWKSLTDEPFEIIEHTAGVRPAIKDRRPVIGLHPNNLELGIFNGLGAKGVTLAPFFAKHFTGHLINGSSLIKEVNIDRFVNV